MSSPKTVSWDKQPIVLNAEFPVFPTDFPLLALASPARNRSSTAGSDSETSPTHARLAKLFGFTRAEAQLAVLLMTGKSVAESAQELGVSIHTVRSHLKRLMSKTGTRRQGALVGLLHTKMQLAAGV